MADVGLNAQVKTEINQKLVETGEKEKLKEMLRKRLTECGWRDQMKEYAKARIHERGISQITVDELVNDITPRGRDLVPDIAKRELLAEIKEFLSNQS
ncbi:UNVERIFIED_CONTAM: hypothetical protein RMT77_003455 [Armadillidium vulgare]|nr:Transcription and mRNA export factor ENY2 [Armadillidium vulgare]